MKLREMSGSPVLLPIEDSSTTNIIERRSPLGSSLKILSSSSSPWRTHNDSNVREAAKVCRLYDIANVLSSLNFIEKTQQVDTRKPAF
ncbi:hypothetical protein ZEAMMB73_Zm00001d044746 [Zea mays]|uniref:E2F/DP family winged-helix DNA-binding domain-containing protein n=2 Tax=Zea mays TaxID=4577 RepID=A0A1D6NR72_MAIZE|nr:hypothetical protein ZEAMMB73_Zm00001d044746 [Zea mays]